jgi:hypothetical protein
MLTVHCGCGMILVDIFEFLIDGAKIEQSKSLLSQEKIFKYSLYIPII